MYKKADCNNLVDITAVKVDKDLPQAERVADFKKQIKDTGLYECEGFTIHAIYSKSGDRVEECLRGMKAL